MAIVVLFVNLFNIQIINNEKYKKDLVSLTKNTINGDTAPRGRIYDRNNRLLVDNEPNKVIYYKKEKNVDEIHLAYQVADLIDLDYSKLKDDMLRDFYINKYPDIVKKSITEDEYKKLEERKLTKEDIKELKKERITEEELNKFNDLDKETAYLYYLMNKGYSYSEKIIKDENVTDLEYANIASRVSTLDGFNTKLDWNRTYLYGDTFRSILGSISALPYNMKEYYLKKGYDLNDRVGTSYIEYQYDDYLKGEKNIYEVSSNGVKTLVREGVRGSDITLTIDINLQKEVDRILEEEILKAKNEANTEYYNRSFVIITDPKTGGVLAMSGRQIKYTEDGYTFVDYTPGILTDSVTVGSVVKGASHIVGYNTGALQIGEVRNDTCVKLAGAPLKCSWKSLGTLNDITALKMSSNTYQFYTAMRVGGLNYIYNTPFKVSNDAFNTYRNTFSEFGLGVKTMIDLPNEFEGYRGSKTDGGLLLDYSIGQYDNYTPIQLSQYITTLANNGTRIQPYLLKSVSKNDKTIYESSRKELNKVNTKEEYLARVKLGFQEVMNYGGTGSGYISRNYRPAGKTGTSQSFIDTDNDGKIDKETVTNTFVAYAPYDDPKVTFTVISPDIYNYDSGSNVQTYVNKHIATKISEAYFNMYPIN